MQAFYNPTTEERVNERVLYANYGVVPETAAANGWYPFDISPIAHDRRFYYLEENGVVPGDEPDTYKINWNTLPLPVELVRETLKKELASYRYIKETDGITVNGSTILTDRESQATITGAKAYSDVDLTAVVNWKSPTGWVEINRDTILALAQAVGMHVQTCFTREKAICDLIDAALSVEDLITVSADMKTGWPETAGVNTPKNQDRFGYI